MDHKLIQFLGVFRRVCGSYLRQILLNRGQGKDLIGKHYIDHLTTPPSFSLQVRECEGVTPKIWVRVDRGGESAIEVDNLSADQILGKIGQLQ